MDELAPPDLRIDDVAHLDSQRWDRAIARTNETIINRLRKPSRDQYFQKESDYPPVLVGAVVVLLALVALAAFLISAGKQIVAFDQVNRFLWERYGSKIGAGYGQVIVSAALLLSEAGVILFGLAANILTDEQRTRRIFRAFQVGCMLIALSANISVTAVNVAAEMPVFDWLVTLLAPVTVIGIGVVVEALAHRWIMLRKAKLEEYRAALAVYEAAIAEPSAQPGYNAEWGNQILDQLLKVSAKNKTLIEQLIEQDPTVRAELAEREWARRQWAFNPGKPVSVSETRQTRQETAVKTAGGTKMETALSMLKDDPTLRDKTTRELEAKTGISKSVWSIAFRRLDEEEAAA